MPICTKCGKMQPSAEVSKGACKDKVRCKQRVTLREQTKLAEQLPGGYL